MQEAPDVTEPDVPDATFTVAYEDEHLLVVDKPAGVVVHPQACACHMAAATFMGLLQDGSRVSYLSLTGPKASVSLLQQLETLAP